MCGIHVSVSRGPPRPPGDELRERLVSRGPDWLCEVETSLDTENGSFRVLAFATVLSMRGRDVTRQPLVFDHMPSESSKAGSSILCWNGEAWRLNGGLVTGNDSRVVFEELLCACRRDLDRSRSRPLAECCEVADVVRSIAGPFAFVFLDGLLGRLFFRRDCLGRRSLLMHEDDDTLTLSSLADPALSGWHEVTAEWVQPVGKSSVYRSIVSPISYNRDAFPLNSTLPAVDAPRLTQASASVDELDGCLRDSLQLRINSLKRHDSSHQGMESRVAVLFSGGLDCTVLARLIHDYLPPTEPVDLLNVAFENPRTFASAQRHHSTPVSPFEICPDRITARSSLNDLIESCPTRLWRLVEIDIPFSETEAHQARVMSLMYPHDTEMDLSIALALYFASRGIGSVGPNRTPYTTPARVLISGLGADELFGGYTHHTTAFQRGGHAALLAALQLDLTRLPTRNLGRDDRVLAHWAREPRFPYLDEALVAWAARAPIAAKTGFGLSPLTVDDDGLPDQKLVLRLLAARLGLHRAAREAKRAIQFGARTAKMRSGRSKGTDAVATALQAP